MAIIVEHGLGTDQKESFEGDWTMANGRPSEISMVSSPLVSIVILLVGFSILYFLWRYLADYYFKDIK